MVSLLADRSKLKPQQPVNVHFASSLKQAAEADHVGGGPIVSRNCSSLAVDFGNDVWLFDVADGTLGRLHQSSLKMSNISRIFISHMHGDHVLGLVAVLKQIMTGVGMSEDQLEALRKEGKNKKAHIHIYAPPGARHLIRLCLRLCSISLTGSYAVHELLEADQEPSVDCIGEELPVNEAVGEDIRCDEDGVWRGIVKEGNGKSGRGWGVSAGPLEHRVPCRGYVLLEPTLVLPLDTPSLIPLLTSHKAALAQMDPPIHHPLSVLSRLTSLPPTPFTLPDGTVLHPPAPSGVPPRKLVIFGDCSGGTPNVTFASLCADPSLLVHECTNAAIPARLQKGEKGRKVRVMGLEHSMVKKVEINKGEKLGNDACGCKDGEGGKMGGEGCCISGDEHGEENGRGCDAHGGSDADAKKASREAEAQRRKEEDEEDEKKRVETQKRAKSRGHSTPIEVGEFAAKVRARRVVVNHFSAMFPSPRYPTTSPYPSILSPISPFPHPIPYPLLHSPDPEIPPHPLTEHELHLRIMMHNIIDQIDEAWASSSSLLNDPASTSSNAVDTIGHGGDSANGNCAEQAEIRRTGGGGANGVEAGKATRAIVTARDFMVLRIPSHELSKEEVEVVDDTMQEARAVTRQWSERGGVWLEGEKGRHWVGHVPEPEHRA